MENSSSSQNLTVGFWNVMFLGEVLQMFLARREFMLSKYTVNPEPEIHVGLLLTDEIRTWADFLISEKNGFRITANTKIENDPVRIDVEPPKGGSVKLDVSFENNYAYIAICRPDGKAEVIYLISRK